MKRESLLMNEMEKKLLNNEVSHVESKFNTMCIHILNFCNFLISY